MALKIVHLAGADPDKTSRQRKLSKKEIIHRKAVEGLAARRIHDQKRAEKLFAPEIRELEVLKERLAKLKEQC